MKLLPSNGMFDSQVLIIRSRKKPKVPEIKRIMNLDMYEANTNENQTIKENIISLVVPGRILERELFHLKLLLDPKAHIDLIRRPKYRSCLSRYRARNVSKASWVDCRHCCSNSSALCEAAQRR